MRNERMDFMRTLCKALLLTLALCAGLCTSALAAGTNTVSISVNSPELCSIELYRREDREVLLCGPGTVSVSGGHILEITPASGYRIADVACNGESLRVGFIEGAYGGMATSRPGASNYTITIEPVPETLPAVQSAALYADEALTKPLAEGSAIPAKQSVYARTEFDTPTENYEAFYEWQYAAAPDAAEWTSIHFWDNYMRCDLSNDYVLSEHPDLAGKYLRAKVTGQADYTTGGPVYTSAVLLTGDGVPAVPESPDTPPAPQPSPSIPEQGTAYATSYAILVDGQSISFDAYALKDASGNDTNFLKLRDLAHVLNGTAAQFDVGWDSAQGAIVIVPGAPYTSANGTEMSAPFTGNQAYVHSTAPILIGGEPADLTAITLTDASGGGYTYFKLRDLGAVLGFQVDWDAQAGAIVIRTAS